MIKTAQIVNSLQLILYFVAVIGVHLRVSGLLGRLNQSALYCYSVCDCACDLIAYLGILVTSLAVGLVPYQHGQLLMSGSYPRQQR